MEKSLKFVKMKNTMMKKWLKLWSVIRGKIVEVWISWKFDQINDKYTIHYILCNGDVTIQQNK